MKSTPPRQRCVCRQWYVPHRAAVRVQKTCSVACRRKRRRQAARRRRNAAPEEYREAERKRQAALRLRRAVAAGVAKVVEVSRADLFAEVAAVLEVALERLDEPVAMSRADLRRQVLDAARESTLMLGQGGTGKRPCHAPA